MEDEPNDVTLVQMEFNKASVNLRLRFVNDGREAIEYLEGAGKFSDRQRYPVPNVILLDLKMPRIGGFEFLQWLRNESAPNQRVIPVVIMSSSSQREDVDRAYALGANSYLVKPVDWPEFKERIQALGIYWAWHSQTPEPPYGVVEK